MKIIKLSAINSTNAFLKEMVIQSAVDDMTVVVTDHQTQGRGQMDTQWISEPFKNLTFSLFTRIKTLKIQKQSYLNFAISLAVYDFLKGLSVPNVSIKWPNDIMADDKKICGILVETTLKKDSIKNAIIGIGLNVNQIKFAEDLNNATSLKLLFGQDFDLELLLNQLLYHLDKQLRLLRDQEFEKIYTRYQSVLYKKDVQMKFVSSKKDYPFVAKIIAVAKSGQLILELENESLEKFDTKEIRSATT